MSTSDSTGPNMTGTEHLFIEIICPTNKILFGVVYKAPDVDELGVFDDLLTSVASVYSEIIIVGDINEDILLNNARSRKFRSNIKKNSMEVLNTTYATHFPSGTTSSSLIDLLYFKQPF